MIRRAIKGFLFVFGLALTCLGVPSTGWAGTYFVTVGGAGSKNGADWSNAYQGIQPALNAVSNAADANPTVYIAKSAAQAYGPAAVTFTNNIALQLLRLLAPPKEAGEYGERLRAGGLGYGDLKKALFEHYWNYFAAARARRAELAADPAHVNRVLEESAAKARALARKVLARARLACGLD